MNINVVVKVTQRLTKVTIKRIHSNNFTTYRRLIAVGHETKALYPFLWFPLSLVLNESGSPANRGCGQGRNLMKFVIAES